MDATDWSWGALIFDFENDGRKDIFVSNGILKDIMSMDFLEFYGNEEKLHNTSSKGKFDYKKFISTISTTPLQSYAFSNIGNLQFKNKASSLGFARAGYSNGAAYGDLDNDGDLDLVVNNNNAACYVYRNDANKTSPNHFLKIRFKGEGKNVFGIGAEVRLKLGQSLVLQITIPADFRATWNRCYYLVLKEPHQLIPSGNWPDGKRRSLQM